MKGRDFEELLNELSVHEAVIHSQDMEPCFCFNSHGKLIKEEKEFLLLL